MKYSQRDISTEKLNELFSIIRKEKHRILFKCAYYFCLRNSEVRRLNIKDIDFANGIIYIKKQKNKSIGFNEPYPIPKVFQAELNQYTHRYKDKIRQYGGYLFYVEPKYRTNPHYIRKDNVPYISSISVWNAMNRYRKKLGLQENTIYKVDTLGRKWHKFCFHTLKAKRIKEVHRITGDVVQTQCMAHHEDFKTTMRYIGNPIHDLDMKKQVMAKIKN